MHWWPANSEVIEVFVETQRRPSLYNNPDESQTGESIKIDAQKTTCHDMAELLQFLGL